MTKNDGRCLYLCATERWKTESSRNKTHFRVIACICTRNRTSEHRIVAKEEYHHIARTYNISQATARVAQLQHCKIAWTPQNRSDSTTSLILHNIVRTPQHLSDSTRWPTTVKERLKSSISHTDKIGLVSNS